MSSPENTSPPDGQVFVVDDDESVRDAVELLLETVDLPVMTFANANEFLDWYSPDVRGCLVLDIRMPGMSGLELQSELKRRDIAIPIVFITGHGDIPMAVEAMREGAVDFIRKPFRDQELLDRVNEALDIEQVQHRRNADLQSVLDAIDELTPREREVFDRVCEGQANKVIAIELGISERTVEIHRGQVMRKTEARSLAELVRIKLSLENQAT